MKKQYKIILAVIITVWVFAMALEINRFYSAKLAAESEPADTVLAAAEGSEETTSKSKRSVGDEATEAPDKDDNQSDDKTNTTLEAANEGSGEAASTESGESESETTTKKSVESSETTVKEDKDKPQTWSEKTVLKKLRAAINQVEVNNNSFTITQTKTVELEILDCSQDSLLTALNNIVQSFAGENEFVYNFENGIATNADGVTVTPEEVLLPTESSFRLRAENIAYASAQENGENVLLTVKISKETVDYNSIPANHAAGIGYINFSKLDFGPASITQAQMLYKRSTIKAVINDKGELLSLSGSMPFKLTASGRLGKAVDAEVSGTISQSWRLV